MKGVKYYFDEHGEPIAVLIDLKINPEIWEDFRDMMNLEKRRHSSRESAEVVRAKVLKKRKDGAKK